MSEKDRVSIKDEATGRRLTLEAREVFEQYHRGTGRMGCGYRRFVPTSAPRQACPECGAALDQRRVLAMLPPIGDDQ